MAVLIGVPTPIPPFDPQELLVPPVWSSALLYGLIPTPGDADAVTLEVLGAGEEALNPVGNAQVARENPQTALGTGGAVLTVRESLALFPVSSVPTKRLVVVLL